MILNQDGVDRYFLHDYESGTPYEVSKEYYEQHTSWMKKMWGDAIIKLNTKYKGTIIIGTVGSFESPDFQQIFNAPKNYNIVNFTSIWEDTQNTKLSNYFKPAFMSRQFIPPTPLGDDDLMPSGKHKGTKMILVPAKYLLYIYENDMTSERVKQYIESNLDVIKQQAKAES